MSTAKETVGQLATQAKDTATETLDGGKDQAVDTLSGVADMLHGAGDSLREHDQDAFAGYADAAAQQVEQFVEAIRGRSVGDLLDEAERFARREPSLFLGGAFVLGIFGARFLKSGMGGTTGGASARSLLSGMTMPGSGGHPDRVSNVNRPAPGGHLGSVMPGEAGISGRTPGTMPHVSSPTTGNLHTSDRAGGMTGGNLPAGNAAAGGASSMGTALGTAGAGADAPIRSGPGATPLSGETTAPRTGDIHTQSGGSASGGMSSGSTGMSGGTSGSSGATSAGSSGGTTGGANRS
ncbi:MAG TPA: hypothetical protein VF594_10625 [Rubricoccaceae bacterium]|jgi:hypothetical protein